MSAWELPTTVEVAGRSFAIRSDFRAVLDALAALTDPDLTQQEQYIACLQILYPRWKELPDANAALRAAFTFINEGKEDEQQGFHPRLVDWEQDAALIAPAVDKVLGYSCRRCGYLVGISRCVPRRRRRPVCAGGEHPQQAGTRQEAGKVRTGICPRECRHYQNPCGRKCRR